MGRHNKDVGLKRAKPIINLYVWTERFLGSEEKAIAFLELIRSLEEGKWEPEKWSQFEPVKEAFTAESDAHILSKWTEEGPAFTYNWMFFKKSRPKIFVNVTTWKGRVPDLNYMWCDMDANQFQGVDGVARLKNVIAKFITWSGAAYATAYHSLQLHHRSVTGNPTQRLERLNWLNFFGKPYVDMFGKERIRHCPFYSCETLDDGLLVTAAECPDSSPMVESSDCLIALEKCLGADAFASYSYPEVPCRVPAFDLKETLNHR